MPAELLNHADIMGYIRDKARTITLVVGGRRDGRYAVHEFTPTEPPVLAVDGPPQEQRALFDSFAAQAGAAGITVTRITAPDPAADLDDYELALREAAEGSHFIGERRLLLIEDCEAVGAAVEPNQRDRMERYVETVIRTSRDAAVGVVYSGLPSGPGLGAVVWVGSAPPDSWPPQLVVSYQAAVKHRRAAHRGPVYVNVRNGFSCACTSVVPPPPSST